MKIAQVALTRMMNLIRAMGVNIDTLDDDGNVQPVELQAAAQPIIDSYNPRDDLKMRVDALRFVHETGGFMFQGKLIQSDQPSFYRIIGAALAALIAISLNQPFTTIPWKTADNSTIDLDAMGVLGLLSALMTHGSKIHIYTQQLKARIDAGEDVDIEAGWPT
jgi:hypothetical protein